MGGGMALRLSHQVPDWMIAFFYTGPRRRALPLRRSLPGRVARKDVLTLALEQARSDS